MYQQLDHDSRYSRGDIYYWVNGTFVRDDPDSPAIRNVPCADMRYSGVHRFGVFGLYGWFPVPFDEMPALFQVAAKLRGFTKS